MPETPVVTMLVLLHIAIAVCLYAVWARVILEVGAHSSGCDIGHSGWPD